MNFNYIKSCLNNCSLAKSTYKIDHHSSFGPQLSRLNPLGNEVHFTSAFQALYLSIPQFFLTDLFDIC